MKFKIQIKQTQIDKAYKEALSEFQKDTSIKGFRKGKAPAKMVEEKIGKTKIQNHALEHVIPELYLKEIKKRKLNPIAYPEIKPQTVEKDGSWVFEVEVIEKPEITLGDYKTKLKAASTKSKIWTPDKAKSGETDQSPKQNTPPDEDPQLKLIFDTLLDTCKLTIPTLLVKRETDRMLSKLVDQVNQLGLNVEDYAKSIGKSVDQIRQDYEKSATDNLKLEFLLQELAMDLKIDVADQEVDALISSVPDEKSRQQLQTESGRINLKLVLLKRKTVAELEKIARS